VQELVVQELVVQELVVQELVVQELVVQELVVLVLVSLDPPRSMSMGWWYQMDMPWLRMKVGWLY
jgi:hypothetical protein